MVAYVACAYLYRLEAYATLKSGRHQRSGSMNLKNLPDYHQEVVKALIILVAVLLQSGVWARRMPSRLCRTSVG